MHRAGWMRVRNAFKPAAVRRQSTKASVGDGGAKAGIGDGGEPLHTKGGGGGGGEAGNGSGESTEGPPVVIPVTLAGIAMWTWQKQSEISSRTRRTQRRGWLGTLLPLPFHRRRSPSRQTGPTSPPTIFRPRLLVSS